MLLALLLPDGYYGGSSLYLDELLDHLYLAPNTHLMNIQIIQSRTCKQIEIFLVLDLI